MIDLVKKWRIMKYRRERILGKKYLPDYTSKEEEYIEKRLLPLFQKTISLLTEKKVISIVSGLIGDLDGIKKIEEYVRKVPEEIGDEKLYRSIIKKASDIHDKIVRDRPSSRKLGPNVTDMYVW